MLSVSGKSILSLSANVAELLCVQVSVLTLGCLYSGSIPVCPCVVRCDHETS
jgi:hypothetical protein